MSSATNTMLGVSLISAAGMFCLCMPGVNTEWFFANSKAAFWVRLLGRNGARWFYGILGLFILLIGWMSVLSHL